MKIDPRFKDARVIPLKHYSKIPAMKWGNDDVLPFSGDETGYGIDTGRSGLVVIDCDIKDDLNGVAAFIEAHQEATGEMPDTYSVESPNGGIHFYYRSTDKNAKSTVSSVLPGVDVRANGGYIVGPGSQVKNKDGNIKTYTPEDPDAEIADLPKWIADKVITKEKPRSATKSNAPSRARGEGEGNSHEQIEQKNTLNWAIDKMASAKEGGEERLPQPRLLLHGMQACT